MTVDNCYGEFVEDVEPTAAGADLIMGSLIKNPGGTLATCGGYIAGKVRAQSHARRRACEAVARGGACVCGCLGELLGLASVRLLMLPDVRMYSSNQKWA